ncbi:(4Fe-4S)-binding protein [Roseisolibacter sp. H3M3-2]|uniref:(4Fe-4S)-binding protein n=1 Tax=Roseisolibacter sp. H3M3-2 TaxID=3031323 RepID=UPI0023DCD91D|nr:(4Fe-4S)-binding protein [Roseisolibacter sp. H3M3-2]MDF1503674.1 (4Fe-4S)-binding protein [Roseisolibacter sp. H3M3-2]
MPKRLQRYETDEIAVTFDPNRCIHAAACVRGLPLVFDPKERRWVRLEHATADDVAATVARCPTGALRAYRPDGAPASVVEATEPPVTVRARRDGPLYVRGPLRIQTEAGELLVEDERVALCRCGGTGNAPFCDGSHTARGFTG